MVASGVYGPGDRVGTPAGRGTLVGFLLQDADGVRFVKSRSRGRPPTGMRVFAVVRLGRTGRRAAFALEQLFDAKEGRR